MTWQMSTSTLVEHQQQHHRLQRAGALQPLPLQGPLLLPELAKSWKHSLLTTHTLAVTAHPGETANCSMSSREPLAGRLQHHWHDVRPHRLFPCKPTCKMELIC